MQSNLCIAMHVSLLASDEESDGKLKENEFYQEFKVKDQNIE